MRFGVPKAESHEDAAGIGIGMGGTLAGHVRQEHEALGADGGGSCLGGDDLVRIDAALRRFGDLLPAQLIPEPAQ